MTKSVVFYVYCCGACGAQEHREAKVKPGYELRSRRTFLPWGWRRLGEQELCATCAQTPDESAVIAGLRRPT